MNLKCPQKLWMFFRTSNYIQKARIWNMGISNMNDHIEIMIKMINPNQDPPVFSEALIGGKRTLMFLASSNQYIQPKFWNLVYQRPMTYLNHDQECKPHLDLKHPSKPQSWIQGHVHSFLLLNQSRQVKFWTGVYQRNRSISELWSWFQIPIRNLQ